jgi:MYXO-CTERM domain-containing protein
MTRSFIALAISGASLLFTANAAADSTAFTDPGAGNSDQKACEGMASGDACVLSGGGGGTCRPRSNDAKILVCDGAAAAKGDVACLGKAKGDPCPLTTGVKGTCRADDTNPSQLRCKDESPVNPSSDCTMAAGGEAPGAPWAIAALGIAAACLRRRRRPSYPSSA